MRTPCCRVRVLTASRACRACQRGARASGNGAPALRRAACASSPRSAISRLASGASPAQPAAPESGPLRCGPKRERAWHPGGVRRHGLRLSSGSSARKRASGPSSRRLRPQPIPRCFVGGYASSPRGRSAANAPNRQSRPRFCRPPPPRSRLTSLAEFLILRPLYL